MTSANVSKMTAGVPVQTSASKKSGKEEQETMDFMAMLGNFAFNTVSQQKNSTDFTVSDSSSTKAAEYEKFSVKDDRIPKASKDLNDADMQKVDEAVNEFAKEVQEEVKELLGVDEAQLEAAMQELGLTYQDLMNPSNLAELVMNLTGQEDSLGLLMNADFQELMQDVEVLSQNLLKELGMTPEEAAEVFTQLEQNASEVTEDVLQQMQEDSDSQIEFQTVQTDEDSQKVEQKTQIAGPAEANVQNTRADETEGTLENVEEHISQETRVDNDNATSQQDGQQEEEPENDTTTEMEQSLLQKSDGKEKNLFTENSFQQTVQTVRTDNMPTAQVNTSQNAALDTLDIIRQVSEFTRVMYQGDTTSMEMQLNPENLGKIYVQVTAKEGVITARLAVQNEIVKEALESQTIQLRENMNQQGIKVEAVEVTIASHEFERNLEQNQQGNPQDEQREQASKNQRRNISMNQLDEISGLMSEEEMLVAKMMRDNGNSVDFTA